jgi:hypothetical protein
MKRTLLGAAGLLAAAVTVAFAAGNWPDYPQVGQPSFCGSNVTGVNAAGNTSTVCAQTIPAGPPALTGNELIPADTTLQTPATVTVPLGMLSTFGSNVLVGADFGQALWQRGTTPISAATPTSSTYGPDGWYVILGNGAAAPNATVTVSKQTGATDVFPGALASARIQRVASQTLVNNIQFGQLVPNDSSPRFTGNTAIFSCYMLAGANFSPAGNNVSMIIAYHSAADASAGANGQGTNTGTFGTSTGTTQNITNYTEAVVTPTPITTTWTRYSVAAAIPATIPNTSTQVTGIGVKLQWTPVGTAGANDWLEVANCQLESRAGTSVGPSNFNRRNLSDEYLLETARYWQISENGSAGTPIYASGQAGATNTFNVVFNFPSLLRITPVVSPITAGGFKVNAAGTLQTVSNLSVTGLQQTPRTGALGGSAAITAGQGTTFVGTGTGLGVLGFSAEP